MTLKQEGFRYVRRMGKYMWVHPLELRRGDVDCTDMNDTAFERFVVTSDTANAFDALTSQQVASVDSMMSALS